MSKEGDVAVVNKGTWVEIESVVLTPKERAPGIPPETAKCPLVMKVSGFLANDASLGDEVCVYTMIGRQVKGRLAAINPGYDHSFGSTVSELLQIGRTPDVPAQQGGQND